MRTLRCFIDDQGGATAIEYCLIAGSIAMAIVLGVTSIGTKLNTYYLGVANGLR